VANTLLLDTVSWDLLVDVNGNIAMASNPYSLAQDAASAIRTFLGELWYDTSQGIPYFQTVLGFTPPLSYIKAKLVAAALTVPEVTAAQCFISSIQGRVVSGQVQITTSAGQTGVASF
jgi:hypothetical protein